MCPRRTAGQHQTNNIPSELFPWQSTRRASHRSRNSHTFNAFWQQLPGVVNVHLTNRNPIETSWCESGDDSNGIRSPLCIFSGANNRLGLLSPILTGKKWSLLRTICWRCTEPRHCEWRELVTSRGRSPVKCESTQHITIRPY